MIDLLIPKDYISKFKRLPIIFLAGPILSAPNWQDEAIKIFAEKKEDLTIITPRRGIRERIAKYIIKGEENYFPRQRAWERHYLDIASNIGCIMFWLPGEEIHNCNKIYSSTTRVELGEWMSKLST